MGLVLRTLSEEGKERGEDFLIFVGVGAVVVSILLLGSGELRSTGLMAGIDIFSVSEEAGPLGVFSSFLAVETPAPNLMIIFSF